MEVSLIFRAHLLILVRYSAPTFFELFGQVGFLSFQTGGCFGLLRKLREALILGSESGYDAARCCPSKDALGCLFRVIGLYLLGNGEIVRKLYQKHCIDCKYTSKQASGQEKCASKQRSMQRRAYRETSKQSMTSKQTIRQCMQ